MYLKNGSKKTANTSSKTEFSLTTSLCLATSPKPQSSRIPFGLAVVVGVGQVFIIDDQMDVHRCC